MAETYAQVSQSVVEEFFGWLILHLSSSLLPRAPLLVWVAYLQLPLSYDWAKTMQARRTSAAIPSAEEYAHSHTNMVMVVAEARGGRSEWSSLAGPLARLKENNSLACQYEDQ
jgi:hypothetical protein